MKIKSLITKAILPLLIGSSLFAQSAEYNELLKKAKDYESKKQYVYALGTYWDAMEAEQSAYSFEAAQAFEKLEDTLKKGNPGFGTFDEFSIYDNWVLVCKDFEKYWGEYNPIVVSFEKLKRGDIDRATKTATYTINFHYNWSVKHKRIAEAVLKGLNLVRKADWSQGIPKKWPATSIFEKDVKFDHYISNGIPFFYAKKGDVAQRRLLHDHYASDPETESFHAALIMRTWDNEYDLGKSDCFNLNAVSFSVVDKEGHELLKTPQIMLYFKSYTFKGVNQETMKLIDSDNIDIKLNSFKLKYGYEGFRSSSFNDEDKLDENLLKSPDITQKNIRFLSAYNETLKDEDIIVIVKKLEAKRRLPEFLKNDGFVTVEGGSFTMGDNTKNKSYDRDKYTEHKVTLSEYSMAPTEVPQWLYFAVTGKNPSDQIGLDFPVDCISWLDAVLFCNTLSELAGFTPCYTFNGTTNLDIKEIEKQNKYETVVCDFNANGYRLPTEAEWEYAARGGKNNSKTKYSGSDSIDDVAWYIKNSEKRKQGINGYYMEEKSYYDQNERITSYREIHNIGMKAPNALGLYDMSGNVSEWCFDTYADYPAQEQSNPVVITNKKYSERSNRKVLRGGDSNDILEDMDILKRSDFNSYGYTGMRLARTTEKGAQESVILAEEKVRKEKQAAKQAMTAEFVVGKLAEKGISSKIYVKNSSSKFLEHLKLVISINEKSLDFGEISTISRDSVISFENPNLAKTLKKYFGADGAIKKNNNNTITFFFDAGSATGNVEVDKRIYIYVRDPSSLFFEIVDRQ